MEEILLIVLSAWAVVGLIALLGNRFSLDLPPFEEANKSEPAEPKPVQPEAVAPAPEQPL